MKNRSKMVRTLVIIAALVAAAYVGYKIYQYLMIYSAAQGMRTIAQDTIN